MANHDRYVGIWERLWYHEAIKGQTLAVKWTFVSCIEFARSKGTYRGYLVNAKNRPRTMTNMAREFDISRNALRVAITYLASDGNEMLRWEDVGGRPCLFVVNYDKWQAPVQDNPLRKSAQTVGEKPKDETAQSDQTVGGSETGQKVQNGHKRRFRPEQSDQTVGTKKVLKKDDKTEEEDTPRDFEDRPGGLSSARKQDVRLKFIGFLNDRFSVDPAWAGGAELSWIKHLGGALQVGDTDEKELARWLTDKDSRPKAAEIDTPKLWLKRRYDDRHFAGIRERSARSKGKDRAAIKERKGGRL